MESRSDIQHQATLIIKENEQRRKRLIGKHDQVTGKGMELHTCRCRIPDYPLPEQWLTPEVYNNDLYQQVMLAGTIAAYIVWFKNEYHQDVTAEQVTQQLMQTRLDRDPSFSFAVEYKIKHKLTGKMVPFLLNYAQRQMLVELEKMRLAGVPIRLIIVKARQWGGSTLAQLYISWVQMHVKEGWYAVVIAQTKDTAKRIRAMYEKAIENMPAFLYTAHSLSFAPYRQSVADSIVVNEKHEQVRDNVLTVASYENFETTRGMDYAMGHFSELAYWRNTPTKSAKDVITNIDGNIALVPDTVEIFESTANGQTGYFYDEYMLAKRGKSIRHALFVPFTWIENDMLAFKDAAEKRRFVIKLLENRFEEAAPDETSEPGKFLYELWTLKGATLEHINWYILKRKSFHDHGSMAQEVPCDDIECFVYSGSNVFSPYVVSTLRDEHVRVPVLYGSMYTKNGTTYLHEESPGEGRIKIWRKPDKQKTKNQYLVVVDLGGRSQKSDYSCITVIDRMATLFKGGRLEVVARWHGHLRYDAVARLAVKIASYYKNALLVFESNTFDKKKAESQDFVEQGDHIRGVLDVIGDSYPNLYTRPATSAEDLRAGVLTKIGFQTNRKTKQEMVDWFIPVFEDNMFIDPDEAFYDEAAIYEQKPDGNYGNKDGEDNHDDIIMTNMIGCLVEKDMDKPCYVKDSIDEGPQRGTRNESSF